MKYLFLVIFFFFAHKTPNKGEYDSVINPITIDKLQDETIKQDVFSILHGGANENLYEYETKCTKNVLTSNYGHASWTFYTIFNGKIKAKGKGMIKAKGMLKTYCQANKALIEGISFLHVKYVLRFTPNSLSVINKEILSVFGEQPIAFRVKSYISENRYQNYLFLSITNNDKKIDFVLVINDSEFYECVMSSSM